MQKRKSKEYYNIHNWLRYHYGKASKCEFCNDNIEKDCHWALKKGCEYERNRENFLELCILHHRRYDESEQRKKSISNTMKDLVKAGKWINPCKNKGKLGKDSISSIPIYRLDKNTLNILEEYEGTLDACRKHKNFKNSTISMCLTGKNKTAYGFKWRYK